MNDSEQTLLEFSKYVKLTPEYLASQGLSKKCPMRFWKKVNKNGPIPDQVKYPNILTPCWLWIASKDIKGYGWIGRWRTVTRAHRVSWILSIGPIPFGKFVLHKCDNTSCVNPDHLWIGTHQDNATDRKKKGRGKAPGHPGEMSGTSKLTEKQVLEIRSLYPAITGRELARRYGVIPGTISKIILRQRWNHI